MFHDTAAARGGANAFVLKQALLTSAVTRPALFDGGEGGGGDGGGSGGGDGGGKGGTGGGGDKSALDLSNPAVKAAVEALARAEIDKVVKNRDEILNEKKSLSEKLKGYEGVDVDLFKKLKGAYEQSEEAKLIADGKLDEVLDKRTSARVGEYQQQIDALKAQIEALTGEKDTFSKKAVETESKLNDYVIETLLTSAAAKMGVKEDLLDAVKEIGRKVWRVKDGAPTPFKDAESAWVNKEGKPITVEEWFADLKGRSPSFFKQSSGGGASGSGGGTQALRYVSKDALARGEVSLEDVASGKVAIKS